MNLGKDMNILKIRKSPNISHLFNVCKVYCGISFIPTLEICVFSFSLSLFLVNIARSLSILLIFSNTRFGFIDFLYFLFLISLTFALIFIISFLCLLWVCFALLSLFPRPHPSPSRLSSLLIYLQVH